MSSTDKKQTSRQSSDERLTYRSEDSGRSLDAQAIRGLGPPPKSCRPLNNRGPKRAGTVCVCVACLPVARLCRLSNYVPPWFPPCPSPAGFNFARRVFCCVCVCVCVSV